MAARFAGFLVGVATAALAVLATVLLVFGGVNAGGIRLLVVAGTWVFARLVVVLLLCYILALIARASGAGIPPVILSIAALGLLIALSYVAIVELTSNGIAVTVSILARVIACWLIFAVPKLLITVPPYMAAGVPSFPPVIESCFRGVLIGINTVYSAFFGWLIYTRFFTAVFGVSAGRFLGVLFALWLLALPLAVALFSTNETVKSILGWTVFLTPTSWPILFLGEFAFLIGLGFHWVSVVLPATTPFFGVVALTVRNDYGSIVTAGGAISNLDLFPGAYDLGTFVQINSTGAASSSLATPSVGVTAVSYLQLHESGHGLGLGVFGTEFHLAIGWIDEGLQTVLGALGSGGNSAYAYAEKLAESNVRPPVARQGPAVLMWRTT